MPDALRVGPDSGNYSHSGGPGPDADLVAAAVHGVIEGRRLRDFGLTKENIAYRVRTGRLHRRYPGVFAVGRPDLPLFGEFLAAVLSCGPRAVLSRRSAARLWGIATGGTYRIDVTAPRSIKPKRGIRLHRPLSLDALDTTTHEGIPVTSVAQTLLDLAAPAYRVNVGRLLHEASVQEVLDMRAVWAVLACSPRAPGARSLDEAAREEVPFSRSGLESAAWEVFREFGVSLPKGNQWVWDGEKLVEVDFVWFDERLIVEVDGGRYHSTRWRRRQDAAKTAALRAQGWKVLRFDDVQVAGAPAQMVAAVLTSLRGPQRWQ